MAEVEVTPGVALERSPAAVVAALRAGAEKAAGSAMSRIEQHSRWLLLARLPMKLEVSVPVPGFKVRDLLALHTGQMILSAWRTSEDVPLRIGGVQLAWSEFEVVEQAMAVRLTRLA